MEEILITIASTLFGALVTWIAAHFYYKASNRDQERLFTKLSGEIRQLILSDTRSRLSVKELNELLVKRTIDQDSDDPLPYKACPECGNTNLHRNAYADSRSDREVYIVRCDKCNWSAHVDG